VATLADPLAESAARMEREYSRVPFIARDENNNPVFGGNSAGNYVQKTRRWVGTMIETAKAEMSRDPRSKTSPATST